MNNDFMLINKRNEGVMTLDKTMLVGPANGGDQNGRVYFVHHWQFVPILIK